MGNHASDWDFPVSSDMEDPSLLPKGRGIGVPRAPSHPKANSNEAPKFTLPIEPTESVDKYQEYPPIVTADGEVDTDIDHLMVAPEDDFVDLPFQDIPNKFPKPHVVTVIDGSLDDDIDNLMNHDGTMTHTLIDAPKNFRPGDLKEINSNKEGRKHRSYHKMEDDQAVEGFEVSSYEVVPAREQNNSSEKYPDDEVIYNVENVVEVEGKGITYSEAEKSETGDPAITKEEKTLPSDFAEPEVTSSETIVGGDPPLKEPSSDQLPSDKSKTVEIILPNCEEKTAEERPPESTSPVTKTDISLTDTKEATDDCCTEKEENTLSFKTYENDALGAAGLDLEENDTLGLENAQLDVELIETLTIMCTDAITKLALAEKSLGHSEQQQQLLTIASILKQRLPTEKQNNLLYLSSNILSNTEGDGAQAAACIDSSDLNTQAEELVNNLIQQVEMIDHSGMFSSITENTKNELCRDSKKHLQDLKNEPKTDSPSESEKSKNSRNQLNSSTTRTKETSSSGSPVLDVDVQVPKSLTEFGSTQTSHMNLTDSSVSAALKVAGDSMSAAAKMAEALSFLIKTTRKTESRTSIAGKNVRSKQLKEYLAKTAYKTSSRKHPSDSSSYPPYNALELPLLEVSSTKSLRSAKDDDLSSLEDMGSRVVRHTDEYKKRNADSYHSPAHGFTGMRKHGDKTAQEQMDDESLESRQWKENRRRSRSCKDDGNRHWDPISRPRHRGCSESKCNEVISHKEKTLQVPSLRSNDGSEMCYKREKSRRTSPKENYEMTDIHYHDRERGIAHITIVSPESSRHSRRNKSKKSDKKHEVEKNVISHLRDADKVTSDLSRRDQYYHSRSRDDENTWKRSHRRKKEKTPSAELNVDVHSSSKGRSSKNGDRREDVIQPWDKALPKEGETDTEAMVFGDTSAMEETWSLPIRCISPSERYFDRVVRSLKTWAPPAEDLVDKSCTNYIRSKLVGSVVDPDTRDSDFDSIEFNGNARVSHTRTVHWKNEDDWSLQEDLEYDSSMSEVDSYHVKWHCDY